MNLKQTQVFDCEIGYNKDLLIGYNTTVCKKLKDEFLLALYQFGKEIFDENSAVRGGVFFEAIGARMKHEPFEKCENQIITNFNTSNKKYFKISKLALSEGFLAYIVQIPGKSEELFLKLQCFGGGKNGFSEFMGTQITGYAGFPIIQPWVGIYNKEETWSLILQEYIPALASIEDDKKIDQSERQTLNKKIKDTEVSVNNFIKKEKTFKIPFFKDSCVDDFETRNAYKGKDNEPIFFDLLFKNKYIE